MQMQSQANLILDYNNMGRGSSLYNHTAKTSLYNTNSIVYCTNPPNVYEKEDIPACPTVSQHSRRKK